MADNYYGTVPTLAWIFNHYFYKKTHYTWLAEEYFPYRLPNPKSSNPHLVYQNLYQPWKDKDDFDKDILQVRINVRKGVIAKEKAGDIDAVIAPRLKDICDRVDIVFLYPIVYRVNIDGITPTTRKKSGGSALTVGSKETLVEDLKETEFDILFVDFDSDSDFKKLVINEMAKLGSVSESDAMTILERRRK